MNTALIIQFAKKLLPMAKIGAYVLSVMTIGVAALLGANKEDIQSKYCASEIPDMPKIEAPVAPVVTPVAAPAKK